MANIRKNLYGEFVIDGALTQDDIGFINRLDKETNICFNNTKGISSDMLKQITNDKLTFRVIGGLDPSKRKYDEHEYQRRTFHSKDELIKIIEYFENIEKGITPEMTDMQKCMYIYLCLIQDTHYVKTYRDPDLGNKLIENTLTGNLYHKLTCAGIALTFKELLERQGIKCDYLNKIRSHAFNRVEIDGKTYGMDLTWDLNRFEKEGQVFFTYFGRQDTENFYMGHHDLSGEEDETMDEVNTFTEQEVNECYASVKPLIDSREKHVAAVDQMTKEEKIGALRIHHFYNEIQREESFLTLIRYLKKEHIIDENDYRWDFYRQRYPLVGDLVGLNVARLDNVEGINPSYEYSSASRADNFVECALRATDEYIKSFVNDFFDMAAIYAPTLKYVSYEENEDLYLYYWNLKSKIRYLNSIRELVNQMGYEEELKYFNYILNKEEAKRKEEELDKDDMKSQYDYDYDFLSGLLSAYEMVNIKEYMDRASGRVITMEEFKTLFTDPEYMRKIFKDKWQFNDEELSKLLNESYEQQVDLMIEFMKDREQARIKQEEEAKARAAQQPVEQTNTEFDNSLFGEWNTEDSKNIVFM